MIAGIETGGTKVVCGVAHPDAPGVLIDVHRFPTSTPGETTREIDRFLLDLAVRHPLEAVGVATFGPVNVELDAPRYGWITGTTKPGWANTKLLERLTATTGRPTVLLSDVSGAALGEQRWGAGRGHRSVAYATFGTGVGVGVVSRGRLLHGNGFPELGHLLVRRHPLDDHPGGCPFHGDCVEGLAAGPSVVARWGRDSSSLPERLRAHAFEILGFYIAQTVAAVAYMTGVERVVLGGGVLKAPGLLDEARRQLPVVTGGAHAGHAIDADPFDLMVPPALGDLSGVLGAVAAAADLLGEAPRLPHVVDHVV